MGTNGENGRNVADDCDGAGPEGVADDRCPLVSAGAKTARVTVLNPARVHARDRIGAADRSAAFPERRR